MIQGIGPRHEREKKKVPAKKEKINLFEMGIDIDMIPVVEKWMAYKTERHESYKRKGIEMFYKRLMELSGGSVIRAEKIIEQSMANNYAGIFALNLWEMEENQKVSRRKSNPLCEQLQRVSPSLVLLNKNSYEISVFGGAPASNEEIAIAVYRLKTCFPEMSNDFSKYYRNVFQNPG